ncbi:hypothetical protein ACFX2B_009155 [Malus domestica]
METQSAAAILLKSFRLINSPAAHCHFLDLSVVFLLSLSFFLCSILFPSLLDRFPNFQISTSEAQQNQPPQSPPKPFFPFSSLPSSSFSPLSAPSDQSPTAPSIDSIAAR